MDEACQAGAGGLGLHSLPNPHVIHLMRKLVVFPPFFARRALDFESRAKTPLSGCKRGMERQLWSRQGDVATVHDQPILSLRKVKLRLTSSLRWNRIPPLELTPPCTKFAVETIPVNMKIT